MSTATYKCDFCGEIVEKSLHVEASKDIRKINSIKFWSEATKNNSTIFTLLLIGDGDLCYTCIIKFCRNAADSYSKRLGIKE